MCLCVRDCEGDSTQFSNYGQQIFTATPVTSRSLLRTRPPNWISLSPFLFFVVVYNHISLFLFSSLLWKRFYHPHSCNSVLFINKQLQVRIFNAWTLIVEVAFLRSAIKVCEWTDGTAQLHSIPAVHSCLIQCNSISSVQVNPSSSLAYLHEISDLQHFPSIPISICLFWLLLQK